MTGAANLNIFMTNLTADIVPFRSFAAFARSIRGRDIRMPQVSFRCDSIANSLFHLLHFGKATLAGSRPDYCLIDTNLKHTANSGNEGNFSNFALKRGQQLLRHPRGSQQPPALRAVFYFHARMFRRHALQFSAGLIIRETGADPVNAADFRRIALSLPGAEESSHMGSPDFRVGGRIFATLASEKQGYGNVKLTPEQQADFVKEEPDVFLPVAGGWGRSGMTHVRLGSANEDLLEGALRAAWKLRVERNAPAGGKKRAPSSKR
jgi:hypothetical protein